MPGKPSNQIIIGHDPRDPLKGAHRYPIDWPT
jgi:hypothetical protein